MAYRDFEEELLIKYYARKYLILLKIQNMMDIHIDLLQWFIIFSSGAVTLEIMSNCGLLDLATRQLAEELHKPIIKIRKTTSILIRKYNKWFDTDYVSSVFLVNMHELFLLRAKNITKTFQKSLDEFNCKPNKIWVDAGSQFYNRSFKSWLQDNNIRIYSTHNEVKSVVAERFIRILREKFLQIYNFNIQKYIY